MKDDWRDMANAPTDGSRIIALGHSRSREKQNGDDLDVRLIKWFCGGWNALNNHQGYTVGFKPEWWMPYHTPPMDKSMTAKFIVGHIYWTRSMTDYDHILSFRILGRTEKTIQVEINGTKPIRRIKVNDGRETFYPHGHYSMCPVVWADSDTEVRPMPENNPSYG